MKFSCERCGKNVSVPDDWLGNTVKCPHCGKKTLVGQATSAPREQPAPRRSAPNSRLDEEGDDDLELALAPEVERPRNNLLLDHVTMSDAPATDAPPPPASPKPPLASEAAPKPRRSSKKKVGLDCPNCGSSLPPDGMLCVECGYHVTLGRVLQTELDDVEFDASYGVQRWFRQQLSEGESAAGLLWALHAFVGIVALIIGLMFHPASWIFVALGLALYAGLIMWTLKTKAYLAWGERLWVVLLGIHRRTGWRELSPPFSHRRVFKIREPSFGDEQLGQVQGLAEAQVLDLEGTRVTDRALYHLQGCEYLECVVLRRTRFTRGGVQRLQIMKPDAAIWY
jgi:DNA-directed RNA polymerase subunit RPC12/RpoP